MGPVDPRPVHIFGDEVAPLTQEQLGHASGIGFGLGAFVCPGIAFFDHLDESGSNGDARLHGAAGTDEQRATTAAGLSILKSFGDFIYGTQVIH